MKNIPKISDTELIIMQELWSMSQGTSTDIINALKDKSSWSPKTIHTLISRLLKKGAITVNKSVSPYIYSPIVTEKEVQAYETHSFLNKIYNGSLKMLLNNFLEDESLSQDEIQELKDILNHDNSGGR